MLQAERGQDTIHQLILNCHFVFDTNLPALIEISNVLNLKYFLMIMYF